MKPYPSKHLVFALIFFLGLAARLVPLRDYKAFTSCEAVKIAVSLAKTGAYADAYGAGVGPTAHCPPLHPLLLGILFRIFGTGAHGQWAMAVTASIVSALTFALLPAAATASGIPLSCGLLAGIAGAMVPVNFWTQTSGAFDAPFTAAALIALFIFVCRIRNRGAFTLREGAVFGITSGLACLLNPVVLPVLACWLAISVAENRPQTRRMLAFCALTATCFCAMIAPWAIRNYIVLGSPIWTRSNFWLEMQVSNNDLLTADEEQNVRMQERFALVHPYSGATERTKVKQLGEIAYMRYKRQQALAWISAHKRKFLELTFERFRLFWFPRMARPIQTYLEAFLSVFGLGGLVLLFTSNEKSALLFCAAVLVYPGVYYLIQVTPRYRLPLEPLLFLCGGYFCYKLAIDGAIGQALGARILGSDSKVLTPNSGFSNTASGRR